MCKCITVLVNVGNSFSATGEIPWHDSLPPSLSNRNIPLSSPYLLSSLELTAHIPASMPEVFLKGLAVGLEGRMCVNHK